MKRATLALSSLQLPIRPRRNRISSTIRGFQEETWLAPQHLIYPLFIHDKPNIEPIQSMPGCSRLSLSALVDEVGTARELGVKSVVLFPAIDSALKDPTGEECHNPDGLVPRALRALNKHFPDVALITDVALDPYSSDGHDGIVGPKGNILNDETVHQLCKQAVGQARAGAHIIAPSDMMDGRVGVIRSALDAEGYQDVLIMAYTAKYASAYYGPFRDALASAPKSGDKKTYQMNPTNRREALRELELDEAEGADIVMVKPAGPYLDVISDLRANTALPVAAYQVSGEYSMIKAAVANGWLDEKRVVVESLTAIRRAGADIILTYFAKDVAKYLKEL